MEILSNRDNSEKENWIIDYIWPEWREIDWIFYKNSKLVSFEWKEYIVSNNATLTIQ
jgi:hypothetical protein